MKRIFAGLTFFFCLSMAQGIAQVNTSPVAEDTKEVKACSKSKKACAKSCAAKAAKAANMDESVEQRVCEKSGKVSYYQKMSCPVTGKVSEQQVRYDVASAKFVAVEEAVADENMAPASTDGAMVPAGSTTAKKACCAGKKGKGCCAKGKKSCSKGEMKACSKGEKKACSKGVKSAEGSTEGA